MGETSDARRTLPAVDDVLREPEVEALMATSPRPLVVEAVRHALAEARVDEERAAAWAEEGTERVAAFLATRTRMALRRVLNVTGVVLHTGLGRAPMAQAAIDAMTAVSGYGLVEVDAGTGERGKRDAVCGELLAHLSGAEAGLVTNNNAAAVLLAVNTFARGKEVLVSRGELVEIGGSFRIPELMERAGATLVEVGTTNRTRLADFEKAMSPRTGLILKVHPSNFRLEGFTEEAPAEVLSALGQANGVPVAWDLGSGCFDDYGVEALAEEPQVGAAVASGMDVVTFSGDKCLGGPQAGLVVGMDEPVRSMGANPLMRAVRCDKTQLAGLEATLRLHLGGAEVAASAVPALEMLLRPVEDVRRDAQAIAERATLAGCQAEVVEAEARVGSGSAPERKIPSAAARIMPPDADTPALAARLRTGDPSVFARVQHDHLLMDPRTLLAGQLEQACEALEAALRG